MENLVVLSIFDVLLYLLGLGIILSGDARGADAEAALALLFLAVVLTVAIIVSLIV